MSSIARATSKMASGTFVSRILGQVRLIVLIAALGTAAQADAFQTANTVPNIIYNLIAGGVMNAILVPHIVRAMKRQDDTYVNRLLTVAGTLLFGLTVVLTLGSSVILTIYASQMKAEWFNLAVAFAFWCVPQVFFYGLYTLLGNVLNARNVFGPYMWAPVVNNIIAIVGLVAYIVVYGDADSGSGGLAEHWDGARIAMVGGFATLGVAAQAFVLIYPLYKSGFRFRFTWGLRGSGLGSASKMAGWVFAALVVGQLGNIVLVNVASAANGIADSVAGYVPSYVAYTGAFAIYMLPHSLITVSLVTALFTRMSQHAADRDIASVRADLSFGLRTVGVFTVFASAAFVVLAVPLVQTALLTTPVSDVTGFGLVLVALALGIPGQALWAMAQRVSFAFEDARTVFYIQIPMAAIAMLGGLGVFFAPPHWWMAIVCLGTAVSQWFGGIVGYLALRTKMRRLDGSRTLRTYFRLYLAVIPAAAAGWLLLRFWGPLSVGPQIVTFSLGAAKVIVVGSVMAVIYFALLRMMKVQELDGLVEPILRRLGRGPGQMNIASAAGRSIEETVERKESAVIPLSAGDLLSDRFRLDTLTHTTAKGGELWEAQDTVMGRPVYAVLVPEALREEVLDGARRAAILSDPRLAAMVDVGEENGAGYVVQARPVGRRADQLQVDDDTARAIVGETAAALDAGRKRGVHHGALTSECLTVTPQGDVLLLGLGYLGIAGALVPVAAADDGPPAPLSSVSDAAVESKDPVERSIARSQRDADALLALRAALGGSSEHVSAKNAADVMRAMTPWGEIVLPAEPDLEPVKSQPLWKRLKHQASAPVQDLDDDAQLGGPAAAQLGPNEGTGPALAAIDPSQWNLPAMPESPEAPEFEAIFEGSDDERLVGPAHIATDLPATAVAAEAASAAAGATGAAVSKFAKTSAGFAKTQAEKARELSARLAQERAEKKAAQVAEAEARAAQEAAARAAAGPDTDSAQAAVAPVHTSPQLRESAVVEPETKGRFHWGPSILIGAIIALALAINWALGTLDTKGTPVTLPPRTDPVPVETIEETDPGESAEPEEAPEVVADPAIKELFVLDPEGDGAENQDLTGRALDNDMSTFWRSRSYVNPQYGMKSGIGLDIVLEERALVSEIVIELNGSGGHVQVKTDPGSAVRGEAIAEADMGRSTTITLDEPTELDRVVLWFTHLPVADSDGKNRLEILELDVR